MPRKEMPVVLALPLELAKKEIQKAGYRLGSITQTKSLKGLEQKTCRVVRQSVAESKTINLVVDHSPWDKVN